MSHDGLSANGPSPIKVRVLGDLEVLSGGVTIELTGDRQRRAVLALAAAGPGGADSRALAEVIWDDHDRPADSTSHLRTLISRLRARLAAHGDVSGELIIAGQPRGYRFDEARVVVDLWGFEVGLDRAEAEPDPGYRRDLLDAVLPASGRDPYGLLVDLPGLSVDASRRSDRWLDAEQDRLELWLADGDYRAVIDRCSELLRVSPYRERLRALEALALYRSGRQAEALRGLDQHRLAMSEDLGLDPAPELVDLEMKILNHDAELLSGQAAPHGWLRGYVLGEEITRDDYGVLHHGEQPSIGRPVTIEVVKADYANQPVFMRNFEAEAQRFARLEHPNLVPLYDYWREPDRACLVFPGFRSRTLRDRLHERGLLTREECRLLVVQIGSALSAIHDSGLTHGSVDTSTVFVDSDGNFFLGRFPIAKRSIGSGLDMSAVDLAPHLDRDLLGLRNLVDQAFVGPVRQTVEIEADTLVGNLRYDRPSGAFDSMDEAIGALLRALGDDLPPRGASRKQGGRRQNPYQGLRAFTEADSATFFGREELVNEMLDMLNREGPAHKILAVVGPSGIGKSSAVMAGLVPAIRAGKIRSADQWFVTKMTPGGQPFSELASALLRVSASAAAVAEARLRTDRDGLARVVTGLMEADDSGLVLVIDQFEELFSDDIEREEQRRFLDTIDAAVGGTNDRFRIVLTIRADQWDRPLQHGRFAELIGKSTVHVPSMSPSELERVIVEPAAMLEVGFEDGLISNLVADAVDRAGGLPWVQLALAELWDRMPSDSSAMTMGSYHDLGGVAAAAGVVADKVYLEFDESGRQRIRSVFGRLATRGSDGPDTRRRIPRPDLGDDPVVEEILERFGAARLLSFDRDRVSRDPVVEIAHEALFDGWPRLKGWLKDDRASLAVARRLGEAAKAWQAGGRDEGDLYSGGRLESVESWLADRNETELSADETEFVVASVTARDSQEEAERVRLVHLRRGLAIMAVVAFAAIAATALAVSQRRAAVALAFRSDTLVMVRAAEALGPTDPDLALQLAVTALDRDDGPQARQALIAALVAEPRFDGVVAQLSDAHCWDWSRSSDLPSPLLISDAPVDSVRTIRYEPGLGQTASSRTIPATTGCPHIDPAGDRALMVGNDRLDIFSLSGEDAGLALPVTVAAWSADGSVIVSLGRDGDMWWLRIHDPADLTVVVEMEVDTISPLSVDYAPATGRALILESGVGGQRSSLVDLADGRQVLLEHRAELQRAIFSADGRLVVGVDAEQLHVWDSSSGLRHGESINLVGDGSLSAGLELNPAGNLVAVATGFGVEIYSLVTGEVFAPLAISGRLRFEGNERLLVGRADGSVLAYELNRKRLSRRLLDWDHPLGIVAPDGSVAITGADTDAVGFDLETGNSFPIPTIDARAITGGRIAGYDSDARQYFLIEDGAVTVRSDLTESVPDGLVNMRMPRVEYEQLLVQLFDPGDGEMATNRLLVVDAGSGEVLSGIDVPGVYLSEFLSADEILVARLGGTTQILGIEGELRYDFPSFDGVVSAGDRRSDGDVILGLQSGTTVVWSHADERVVETLVGPASFVVHVLPVDDGVIIQHASGEILRWQWGNPEPVGQLVPPGDFGGLAQLAPDGAEIIVPIDRGIEALPVSVERWRDEACLRMSTTIREDGWIAATGLEAPEGPICG